MRIIKNEEGSAVLEFVVLGLPLFLPLVIFLTSVSQVSTDQRTVQSLARQAARAYVTAPDQNSAQERIEIVRNVFESRYFQNPSNFRNISIQLWCEKNPCLTPDAKVSVTARLVSKDGIRSYSGVATEIVDKWRNSN
jgi:Flp pilus assembly protein TadG